MQSMIQQGRAGLLRRMPLAAVFLCFLVIGCVHCEDFVQPDTSTTKQTGGAMLETKGWTPLFKLCLTAGVSLVDVTYVFPASSSAALKAPYNLSQWEAPWILLYPESSWQDAYFYIVSAPCSSPNPSQPQHVTLFDAGRLCRPRHSRRHRRCAEERKGGLPAVH